MTLKQTVGNWWQRLSGGPREKQALALLRVATGLFFLYQGWQKLTEPTFLQGLGPTLESWATTNPIPPYQQFLQQVAAPHADVFGFLVTYGEIGVGLSFVLGFLMAFSAPAALFMTLNFFLASLHISASLWQANMAFSLVAAALWWGRAGHAYGFDQFVFAAASNRPKKDSFKPKGSKKLAAALESMSQNTAKKSTPKKGGKNSKSTKKTSSKTKPF